MTKVLIMAQWDVVQDNVHEFDFQSPLSEEAIEEIAEQWENDTGITIDQGGDDTWCELTMPDVFDTLNEADDNIKALYNAIREKEND